MEGCRLSQLLASSTYVPAGEGSKMGGPQMPPTVGRGEVPPPPKVLACVCVWGGGPTTESPVQT